MEADRPVEAAPPSLSLGAVFLQFLQFGLLAFGGPVAQIAMIRKRLVEEKRWISPERFNRLLGVMQVLPGPEAHELCVHLGVRARGRIGGLLAGLGFMLPGFALMLALSWLYFALDVRTTALAGALIAVQVAVMAVIARAVHKIGAHILKDGMLWLAALACCAGAFAGISFWLTLPAASLAYALAKAGRRGLALAFTAFSVVVAAALVFTGNREAAAPLVSASTLAGSEPGNAPVLALFLVGLKAGLLTFGGAYTAIPVMRADVADRGWVADSQFLDGVALAQVIPAPLIIFGTFVGYAAGGLPGALAVTAGVFLPAFSFSMIFYDRLESLLEIKVLHAALDGLAAGAVGLMVASVLQLGLSTAQAVPAQVPALVIFSAALAAVYLWKSRYAAPLILLAAGAAGYIVF